jgi:hypothetical protein
VRQRAIERYGCLQIKPLRRSLETALSPLAFNPSARGSAPTPGSRTVVAAAHNEICVIMHQMQFGMMAPFFWRVDSNVYSKVVV